MNSCVHVFGTMWVAASLLAIVPTANAGQEEKSYTGTITAMDAKDNTVKVRAYLFNRQFIIGDDCAFSLGGKTGAALGNFRPGQRVEIQYKDVGGIRIAEKMTEEQMQFAGMVKSVDLNQHTLTVHRRGMDKTFMLATGCTVTGHGNSSATMDNVKLGDRVTVAYEVPQDHLLARKIELPDSVFTGSLDAVDAIDRTVSAGKRYLSDRKFHLADNCVIMANGKMNGKMSDLRLGKNYELSYESVGGVNVVNRIAPAETEMRSEAPIHTVQTRPVAY